jgi:hypothetical protein
MSATEAETLANQLQATLRERVSIDGEMLTRTVSIGVALGVPGRDTTSDLLRRADQALLAAKSGGGNKIAVFSDDMSLKGEFRNDIELHLAKCDRERRPACCTICRKSTCAPARSSRSRRWCAGSTRRAACSRRTPSSEWPNPSTSQGAGPWVMRAPAREFRSGGRRHGEDAVLRINVSPVQLVTEGFVETVAASSTSSASTAAR